MSQNAVHVLRWVMFSACQWQEMNSCCYITWNSTSFKRSPPGLEVPICFKQNKSKWVKGLFDISRINKTMCVPACTCICQDFCVCVCVDDSVWGVSLQVCRNLISKWVKLILRTIQWNLMNQSVRPLLYTPFYEWRQRTWNNWLYTR